MKRRLLSLFTLTALLVSAFAAGFNPAWAQSTLSGSLATFWKMDELSGTGQTALAQAPSSPMRWRSISTLEKAWPH